MKGKDLLDMSNRLFSKKAQVDNLNQEIAEYFFPERATFTSEIPVGELFGDHLTDFYPVLVRRELADQLGALTRPHGTSWFSASVNDVKAQDDRAAKEFLQFMTDVNRNVLYSRKSNYRRAAKGVENDYSAFGMGHMHVAYSKDRSRLMFKTYHPKDCAIDEGEDGRVNNHHRKIKMSPRAMAHEFGEESLPRAVREMLSSPKDADKDTFEVRHIIVPKDRYQSDRKMPKGAEYSDVYVFQDGEILKEEFERSFDMVVPRWQTVSGHCYAFSPATIVALPQARMLQRMMLTLIEGAERRVDPPLIAQDDIMGGPISLESGTVNYVQSGYDERTGVALRALDLGKDVGLGEQLVADSRSLLADAFFINKLTPLANRDKQVTAYEASQLVQEYVRSALPLFEPLEDEWTGQTLEVVTNKAMRAGAYGPVDANGVPESMPDSLLGAEIGFEFNNALSEARGRQTINAFQESSSMIAAAAQIDPGTVADVDTSEMFRDAFGSVPGSRVEWLVDPEKAEAARDEANQAMSEREEVEQLGQAAGVAEQLGGAAQAIAAE